MALSYHLDYSTNFSSGLPLTSSESIDFYHPFVVQVFNERISTCTVIRRLCSMHKPLLLPSSLLGIPVEQRRVHTPGCDRDPSLENFFLNPLIPYGPLNSSSPRSVLTKCAGTPTPIFVPPLTTLPLPFFSEHFQEALQHIPHLDPFEVVLSSSFFLITLPFSPRLPEKPFCLRSFSPTSEL